MPLTPVDLRWIGGEPILRCCDFRDLAFTDPFFYNTYARLRRTGPEPEIVDVSLSALREQDGAGLQPAGFIFHVSRCGSTLVSKLLATCERTLMLGEPEVFYSLLSFPAEVGEERVEAWLRDLVQILGRRRRPSEEVYILKLSSLLVTALPRFRAAFPETPWIFVFRDPGEVMASVLEEPTGFLLLKGFSELAARWLQVAPELIETMSGEEYVARFLGRMFLCALEEAERTAPGRFLLVDYRDLPGAVWTTVAPFLGLDLTPGERSRMSGQASTYSKDEAGTQRFEKDSARKAERLSPAMRAEIEHWAGEPYQRLLRLQERLAD